MSRRFGRLTRRTRLNITFGCLRYLQTRRPNAILIHERVLRLTCRGLRGYSGLHVVEPLTAVALLLSLERIVVLRHDEQNRCLRAALLRQVGATDPSRSYGAVLSVHCIGRLLRIASMLGYLTGVAEQPWPKVYLSMQKSSGDGVSR